MSGKTPQGNNNRIFLRNPFSYINKLINYEKKLKNNLNGSFEELREDKKPEILFINNLW